MLTDVQIRKAKPAEKPFKLYDSGGLHLYVKPNGSKLWRMKYVKDGRERLLSFGPYPDVTLVEARKKRDAARDELREGHDPVVRKRVRRAAIASDAENTFETLASEWCALNKKRWVKEHHDRIWRSLEIDVFPTLGGVPVKEIRPPHVLAIVRQVETRGRLATARLIRQRMSCVFQYAIATGRAENDPAHSLKTVMAPFKSRRQPAVTTIEDARTVLLTTESCPANPTSKLALRFLALTAVRPTEMREMRWDEIEGLGTDEPIWRIPEARMKMRREHVVPLSRQAVEVLQAAKAFNGLHARFVFPGERNILKPVGESTLQMLLKRAGFHSTQVPHGWRATFSTVMNDRYPLEGRIIDSMLAHAPKDVVEGRYNRAEYMPHRRRLFQEWADLLLEGAPSAASIIDCKRKVRTDAALRRIMAA